VGLLPGAPGSARGRLKFLRFGVDELIA